MEKLASTAALFFLVELFHWSGRPVVFTSHIERVFHIKISGTQCKIKGTVVLMRKNVLDINSLTSAQGLIGQGLGLVGSTIDNLTAFLAVSLHLISATKPDSYIALFYFF
ncbi:seed linoleate 9S-lipoxygenase-3-like [Arachis stenosperma]|uniref:seed linoleate 9S-lipoxygenase-3-like n=1 Tax=Arachis stenosperma TaxID=217475 RepID=UPI0025ABFB88|nr:seed linoleate 9S-lipoxygenase-3-like [Arachis stenosperma]